MNANKQIEHPTLINIVLSALIDTLALYLVTITIWFLVPIMTITGGFVLGTLGFGMHNMVPDYFFTGILAPIAAAASLLLLSAILLPFIVYTVILVRLGKTPGEHVLQYRVASATHCLGTPTKRMIFIRSCIVTLLVIVFGLYTALISLLFAFCSAQGRTLQDFIAGTVVLKESSAKSCECCLDL